MTVFGVAIVAPIATSCGTISRSESQTSWAIQRARYRIGGNEMLSHLTDGDIVWLLAMGWAP